MPADVYEPLACTPVTLGGDFGGIPGWQVAFRKPDGTIHGYTFPAHTFTARAGEYGIAAADVDTLIDIVMHEQFMPAHDQDIYEQPVHEARDAHLARVAHAKKHIAHVDHRHPVLAPLHTHHGVTEDVVTQHSAAVADFRRLVTSQAAAARTLAAAAAPGGTGLLPPQPHSQLPGRTPSVALHRGEVHD